MKSVIDKVTRLKIYDTADEKCSLADNEELVDFIPDVMSLDAQNLNRKNIEFSLYQKREYDGRMAYLELSAEFRLAKLAGLISEVEHRFIEDTLKPVRNEVMFGQWKDGLRLLEEIGVGVIGADLYNRLHAQMSSYITENY